MDIRCLDTFGCGYKGVAGRFPPGSDPPLCSGYAAIPTRGRNSAEVSDEGKQETLELIVPRSSRGEVEREVLRPASPLSCLLKGNKVRLSLNRSATSLTLGLFVALGLVGCSGTMTSITGSTPAATSAAVAEIAGDYMVGDTGPGGGIVFYDAGSTKAWGRYLEAAPELPSEEWCDDSYLYVAGTDGYAKTTIGAGAANTKLIAAACGSGAANTVSDYDGGGKTDWFLPSRDELNTLYEQRDTVGGFGAGGYWSSSQYVADDAWGQVFTSGYQYGYGKDATLGVRPVRAF